MSPAQPSTRSPSGQAACRGGPGPAGELLDQPPGDEPDLQPPDSYRATVLKIADLRWKLG
jgi:hypothetical protein